MPCHRKDCDNIMCKTYIEGVGTICDECKSEFINLHKTEFISFKEIRKALIVFIETEKDFHPEKGVTVYEFFNLYTS